MPNDAVLTNSEPSPEEAMVAVFSSQNHDAEMESLAVQTMLEANGIPAMIVGPHVLPNLEFQVQVPERMLAESQRLIEEARAAGPEAAAEAEALTERQPPEKV
jgi:uridine phosphorylase